MNSINAKAERPRIFEDTFGAVGITPMGVWPASAVSQYSEPWSSM
jgi:hypothetical protein